MRGVAERWLDVCEGIPGVWEEQATRLCTQVLFWDMPVVFDVSRAGLATDLRGVGRRCGDLIDRGESSVLSG